MAAAFVILIIISNINFLYVNGFDLTILHTNDVHARFEEIDKYTGTCDPAESQAGKCFGGVARRYTKVQEIRSKENNVILLDAGDQFQGTLWYNYYLGKATAYFVNRLGYDVGSFGNHEFDNGPSVLGDYIKNLTFPIVACNVDTSKEPALKGYYSSSVILNIGGEQIGVIGYVTPDTTIYVPPKFIVNIAFKDEIDCIKREVQKFQSQGINKIIALGHSGFKRDKEIAKQVDGIDVIVGGHTNTFLYTGNPPWPSTEEPLGPYPTVITNNFGNKVYIVQDYAFGKYLGYLKLTFDQQGVVTSATGNPILLDKSVQKDPTVYNEILQWQAPLQSIALEVIGKTYVQLQSDSNICRLGECNLGNLVTDAVLYKHLLHPGITGGPWSETAVAVWNSGGLRSSLQQGIITFGKLSAVLPFRNEVVGFKMQGKYIKELMEQSVRGFNTDQPPGAFLQVSGIKVEYEIFKPPGQRVKIIHIRCSNCTIPKYEPLDDNQVYSMLTSSFLMDGGDGYDVLVKHAIDKIDYGTITVDSVREYIKQHSPIIQGLEGRITVYTEDVNVFPPVSATPCLQYQQCLMLCVLLITIRNMFIKSGEILF